MLHCTVVHLFLFFSMHAFNTFFLAYSAIGLLCLRVVIGAIFLYHGPKKLGNMASFMGFIGMCETLGGLAVLFGFLTQLAALGLGIIMIGATYKKINEWHVPFYATDKTGWELDVMILGGCIVLLTMGAGIYSVDQMVLGL